MQSSSSPLSPPSAPSRSRAPLTALLGALSLTACALPVDDTAPSQPTAATASALGDPSDPNITATITTVRAFAGGIHGLGVAPSDRLYLSNSFGSPVPRQVYYLDPPYTGAYIATGITSTSPAGITFQGGHFYLADVGGNTVRQFDANHNLVRRWSASAPWNLAILPDGTLLTVSNGGSVQRLLPNTKTAVTLFSGLDAPFGIAANADGTFWVSEQGAINPGAVTRRNLAGQILESIPYAWNNPEGLFVDRQGALWIAETGLGEILRYHQGVLEVVGSGLGLPVVLTQKQTSGVYCQGPETIYANSANNPAVLYAIDPCS